MGLASSKTEFEVPESVDIDDLMENIGAFLKRSDDVKSIQKKETEDGILFAAETKSTLFTWGQEIQILISGQTIKISVESPDQWIDWGQSETTVRDLTDAINNFRSNRGEITSQPPA